jgi:hypothetical protein
MKERLLFFHPSHQLMSTYSHYIAHERSDEHVIQFDVVVLQYILMIQN